MERRLFTKLSAAALSGLAITPSPMVGEKMNFKTSDSPDVVVVGAGVMGVWTAFYLQQMGAQYYLFACGPWLGRLFPSLLSTRLKVERRDVLFFGPAPGDARYSYPQFPVWTFEGTRYYGTPDIHGRGFKVAPFPDKDTIDMDADDRLPNPIEIKRARGFLARRLPGLKDQPVVETRVCQLTFTSDEHFIIDQHPELDNTWIIGGGSGHAFKHGPALGEYVAKRVLEKVKNEEYDRAFRLE